MLSNDVCTYAAEYLKSVDEHHLSNTDSNCAFYEHNWIYCMCIHTYIRLSVMYNRLEYKHTRLTVYVFPDLTAVL